MKRKAFFIALNILFSVFLFAQDAPNITDSGGKKQGHWIKVDENKKKIYDGNFMNNSPEGKFIYYFESGVPKAITIFSQNGGVAYTKHFNVAGKMVGEGKYMNQNKDSLWKFYDEEGKLLSEDVYLNGIKNGNFKVYYRNGQLSENKIWVNGKLDGPCTKYFENGTVKYKGQYSKDKVDGKAIFYYPTGNVSVDGFYKNDLKDGAWTYYNQDGTLNRKVLYENGVTKDKSENVIFTKEEEEKAKKQSEQNESKDSFKEGVEPK